MHISINYPNLPPGTPITIPGLGGLENGKEYDVTDEEVAVAASFGFTLPEDGKLGVTLAPPGPTKGTDDMFWDTVAPAPPPLPAPPATTTGGEVQ